MAQSIYDDLILDHIKNARNHRELPHAQRRAERINPLCGDTIRVYLAMDGERIQEASFQCSCCGISMASASVMTESVRERTLDEAAQMVEAFTRLIVHPEEAGAGVDRQRQAILSVVRASPSRGNCAALAWHTLQAALQGQEKLILQRD